MERGLRYNLGLIEANQASADVRAERLRALSALLPQLEARARQGYENLSYKEIGLKLPPIPGLPALPSTSGGFGYQDARVSVTQSLYNAELRNRYRARKSEEQASRLSIQDSRDVVVFAVGTAYVQVISSAARVETAKAQLASADELDQQTANRVKNEVSPEIDSIRAQVERQSAEQRLTNASNQLEKDRLTLARIIGLAVDQEFALTDALGYHPLSGMTGETAARGSAAFARRSPKRRNQRPGGGIDCACSEGAASAGHFRDRGLRRRRRQHREFQSGLYGRGQYFSADLYGRPNPCGHRAGAGRPGPPRGGVRGPERPRRLRCPRRMAGSERVGFQRKVAERNKSLAERALVQSQDRYTNGVTNYLEVVQAQEAVTVAGRELHSESVLVQRRNDFFCARRRRRGNEAPRASRRKVTWQRPSKQKSRICKR